MPPAKSVETLRHDEATRKNIPTAEYQSVIGQEQESPREISYARRNRDLDPQLVWRGKDEQDWSDLVVQAPPLYIQEKVHPKVLIDDLVRLSRNGSNGAKPAEAQLDLFADFNGIPEGADKTEFYQHDQNWSNRMILGDSLQVMASLAERENLRGQVQCIYIDPPYGIKFNSNFQWSTTSRDVKDGNVAHITREPEQVKAFRDTWRDGIHSYLTYLRDRLTVARDLLADSGSIFVQIGDENVHRVRALMDEILGVDNFLAEIAFIKTSGQSSPTAKVDAIAGVYDLVIWYAKSAERAKYRQLYFQKRDENVEQQYTFVDTGPFEYRRVASSEVLDNALTSRRFMAADATSATGAESIRFTVTMGGRQFTPPGTRGWSSHLLGFERLSRSDRLLIIGNSLRFKRYLGDYPVSPLQNMWFDTVQSGFASPRVYVVQTSPKVVERCILMATDPGDLVLDPTCGSGTTAYVAEQWGRRWITIDTSRVALALARARIMGARYPYYLLADSREGQAKEAELTRTAPSTQPVYGSIRHGFVCERVPHVTLKSIANNAEIDVIWDTWQQTLEPLRERLNAALNKAWQEWEVPREADASWSAEAKQLHADWWQARIARQKEIDASIAAKAEFEYLYDKPYTDNRKVRVAGPFTVESLSPHRVLGVDEDGELFDTLAERKASLEPGQSFPDKILDNLRAAGVQQAQKADRITFTSITIWPGKSVCAEARYLEGETERRAAIFIGPEFGTVTRPDLVEAAREAGDGGFDVLIACAFAFEAHTTEFTSLGRMPVLKARMNADLHMSDELKITNKANLFVIFGEPDIDLLPAAGDQVQVRVNGVDVFDPNTGEVRSDDPDRIACWFVDTDYNQEAFFVRQAYFLGANDPYSALKTTLRAEIDEDAWASLHSDTSRAFDKPASGRIAVKVINHLGDEVMKVFRVS
ncbi:MAG TPA: site-specific DNA-methyltransferase [Chloroflexota bacterium]|nr:site-specific DNA-methyltransferase [Chloroflexota bacterium]